MKDPERLGISGTEDQRRLLRAARSVRVPEQTRDEVRRKLEARLRTRPWTRARLFVGAGLLVAATAAAAPRLWQAITAGGPQVPAEPGATAAAPVRPIVVPTPATAPDPATAPGRYRTDGQAAARRSAPPATVAAGGPAPAEARPLPGPELDLPGFLRGVPESARATPAAPPSPAPGRLVVTRSDRGNVDLEATATTVRGHVRGRAIDLTLAGNTLSGRIGDDAVMVRIFGKVRAEGHVGGRDLTFGFIPTERGWIVNASLPDIGGRVKLDSERLAFHPGCDHELRAVAQRPGVYQGDCSDDTKVRVTLPGAFLQMPPLPRLVLLGMLLPEPEPVVRDEKPGLFPPP